MEKVVPVKQLARPFSHARNLAVGLKKKKKQEPSEAKLFIFCRDFFSTHLFRENSYHKTQDTYSPVGNKNRLMY